MINCGTPGEQENGIRVPSQKKLIKHVTVPSFFSLFEKYRGIWQVI